MGPLQIFPGARGESQLIVTHLAVHPSRFLLPARGHTLDIGLVNSPGTPRTTLRTYDTRPIIGSFRIIFRRRCRLSPGSRA